MTFDLIKDSQSHLISLSGNHNLMSDSNRPAIEDPTFLEFFAGSGLVSYALKSYFKALWANDICEKKAAVYRANHGKKHFHLGSITSVKGCELPRSDMSWASFPCQDLSLAGGIAGIHGERSGLVWEWLRILDEMSEAPAILVAENVLGLVSVDNGRNYKIFHNALVQRGYSVGAVALDAVHWVPQSRPRVFVIAVKKDKSISESLISSTPNWAHNKSLIKVADSLDDWVWWSMPEPPKRKLDLANIIEWDAPCEVDEITQRNIRLISDRHLERLNRETLFAAPGYKRTRSNKQVLELRFDGVAGCLRTPKGGSSRQYLILKRDNQIATRLLTIRETARLMGAPDSFKLPGSYNDGYKAMGDAVVAPVARYLAKHLLYPLWKEHNDLS